MVPEPLAENRRKAFQLRHARCIVPHDRRQQQAERHGTRSQHTYARHRALFSDADISQLHAGEIIAALQVLSALCTATAGEPLRLHRHRAEVFRYFMGDAQG